MNDMVTQPLPNGDLRPFSPEDKEVVKGFHTNQLLKTKISGIQKPRSVRQLRLFFACCRTVLENQEEWFHVDQVLKYVKVKLDFVDMQKSIVVGNRAIPHYRSISFKELKHMEATNFFNRAFDLLAKYIGITVDELLQNAEGN